MSVSATLQRSITPVTQRCAPADSSSARELAVLARALPHALSGERERPARWLSTPFVVAVEQARERLAAITDLDELAAASEEMRMAQTVPHQPAARSREAPVTSFAEAVSLLARDPRRVAAATRRIEIAEATRLPSWTELVRRGLDRDDGLPVGA